MGKFLVIRGANFSKYCIGSSSPSEGGDEEEIYFQVSYNLTGYTSSNKNTSVQEGSTFSTTLSLLSGYTQGSIVVTMGGVMVPTTGNTISISSVSGNIVISATAVGSDQPTAENLIEGWAQGYWTFTGGTNDDYQYNMRSTPALSLSVGESVIIGGVDANVRLRVWTTQGNEKTELVPDSLLAITTSGVEVKNTLSEDVTFGLIVRVKSSDTTLTMLTEEQYSKIFIKRV